MITGHLYLWDNKSDVDHDEMEFEFLPQPGDVIELSYGTYIVECVTEEDNPVVLCYQDREVDFSHLGRV